MVDCRGAADGVHAAWPVVEGTLRVWRTVMKEGSKVMQPAAVLLVLQQLVR
jgi:hypothetical protein